MILKKPLAHGNFFIFFLVVDKCTNEGVISRWQGISIYKSAVKIYILNFKFLTASSS